MKDFILNHPKFMAIYLFWGILHILFLVTGDYSYGRQHIFWPFITVDQIQDANISDPEIHMLTSAEIDGAVDCAFSTGKIENFLCDARLRIGYYDWIEFWTYMIIPIMAFSGFYLLNQKSDSKK